MPATIGTRIAQAIKEARNASPTKTLTWSEMASVIDRELAPQPKKAPKKPVKAVFSEFGDKQAIPPTPEQVTAYSASIGFKLDGHHFCDFYEQKGWVVGKAKMTDWQAACRTWKTNGFGHPSFKNTPSAARDYNIL
jgi:hypothetical protein